MRQDIDDTVLFGLYEPELRVQNLCETPTVSEPAENSHI